MRRRDFLSGAAALAACPTNAGAQKTPVIGVLSPASVATSARNMAALRQGLRDLGYIEGQNIKIEYRFAGGVPELLTKLAAELVAINPDVIAVGSTTGIVSASKVTQTVPLIMTGVTENPVVLGLAKTFARPGGNVSGFALTVDQGILGKRLQLLRDAVPAVARVSFIFNPDSPGDRAELKMVPSVAGQFGLQYRLLEARTVDELDAAFAAATSENSQALYVSWNPLFNVHRARITATAARLRLPTIYGLREFVQSGGLMSYGPDLPDLYRRTAAYIDKVLKGEQVGDLPLQLAERYQLVINLNTAKALGISVSEAFLLLADEVIE